MWEALSAHDALAGVLQDIGTGGGERDPAIELTSATSPRRAVRRCGWWRRPLVDALRAGASDIHFEAGDRRAGVKFRIDGELLAVGVRPPSSGGAGGVADQVLAELDIAESRTPQDGRFKARIGGREIDFRVSVMPSLHGEDVVLRILDRERLARGVATLRLENLGFDGPTRRPAAASGVFAPRHAPADWTDRQRQDDKSLRRPDGGGRQPGEDRDHRGPGGIPVTRGAPDTGQ